MVASEGARVSESPRVTVVILSHRKKFLPGALDSVFAQTEQDVQVIVQYSKRNWMSKLNEAVAAAKGEFIVPLCDDDLLAPTYLAECLQRSKAADMIYTDRRAFEHVERVWWKPQTWRGSQPEKGLHLRQLGEHWTEKNAGPKGYFTTQFPVELFTWGSTLPMTCMIRRSWLEQVGGFAEVAHADTELWLRAAVHKARFVYVPQPLFWYRQHPEQYSRTYAESLNHAMAAYHARYFRTFGGLWTGKRVDAHRWEMLFVAPEDREQVLADNPVLAAWALPLVGEPVVRAEHALAGI